MSAIEKAMNIEKSKSAYTITLSRAMRSVVYSMVSPIFFWPIRKPRSQKYLNLGCGGTLIEGWCNADYFLPINNYLAGSDGLWFLNAYKKWNCNDNKWSGICSEHMFEHLTYEGTIHALRECFRTLKPGCYLRISIPDIGKCVNYYNDSNNSNDKFDRIAYGALVISNICQNYSHISVWDKTLLNDILEEIGFVDVSNVNFGEGSDSNIIKDAESRKWESFYVEAKKPL